MIYANGFYKLEGTNLIFGPNFVLNKDYELRSSSKDTYTYPVDGWYWFDSLEEACTFLNLDINDYQPVEDNDN